jgi:hypothetical protein
MKKWCLVVFVLLLLLSSCGGLPKETKERAKKIPERIELMQKFVKEQSDKYKVLESAPDFKAYKVYADREKWANKFLEADAESKRASKEYNETIVPILKKDEEKDLAALTKQMDRVDRILVEAKNSSKEPFARIVFIDEAKEKCAAWIDAAEKDVAGIGKQNSQLLEQVKKVKNDFPAKADEVSTLFAPFIEEERKAKSALSSAQEEYKKHQQKEQDVFVDYALLGDSTVSITGTLKTLKENDQKLRSKLEELYQSYTKILADMRIEYFVTPARISWEESEFIEWPSEHVYSYGARQVDEEIFQYFASLPPEQEIANERWSFSINIDKKMWDTLKINPTEAMPSGDNESDYWIEDDDIKAYHKYIIIRNNGEKEETDWVEVDEEDYAEMEDDLGMAIESKAYGEFESEKHEEPAPPGLAFVGNEKYGEWKKDPASGNTFWHYYGQYAMFRDILGMGMMGRPNYYDYDEYDRWRRDYKEKKQPYYGTTTGTGGTSVNRYGTYGTETRSNSRFANTHFSRTGGFKTADAGVRGAGSANRGGGPGGGGK